MGPGRSLARRWDLMPVSVSHFSRARRAARRRRRDGGMEGWRDGGMEGWRDGGMEGWRDGGMGE